LFQRGAILRCGNSRPGLVGDWFEVFHLGFSQV
jgi:hypothetical protein